MKGEKQVWLWTRLEMRDQTGEKSEVTSPPAGRENITTPSSVPGTSFIKFPVCVSKASGWKEEEFGQEAGCGSQSTSNIWLLG